MATVIDALTISLSLDATKFDKESWKACRQHARNVAASVKEEQRVKREQEKEDEKREKKKAAEEKKRQQEADKRNNVS